MQSSEYYLCLRILFILFVTSVGGYLNKVYLGTAEDSFKQRFYNHRMSLNNDDYSTDAIKKLIFRFLLIKRFIVSIKSAQRQSTRGILYKKDVLKNFTEVTVKHLFWSLFFLNASQIFLKYYRVSQFLKIGFIMNRLYRLVEIKLALIGNCRTNYVLVVMNKVLWIPIW